MPRDDNPLKHAPHTAAAIASSEWKHPYPREQAAFPAPWTRARKFWPPVARINNAQGDRHLVCTCPPIEAYEGPPWGDGDAFVFLAWRAARKEAFTRGGAAIMLLRQERAEKLGLTYEEYTLEILERGRHLQAEDVERIAEIRRRRRRKKGR